MKISLFLALLQGISNCLLNDVVHSTKRRLCTVRNKTNRENRENCEKMEGVGRVWSAGAHPVGFEPTTNGLEIHCSIP